MQALSSLLTSKKSSGSGRKTMVKKARVEMQSLLKATRERVSQRVEAENKRFIKDLVEKRKKVRREVDETVADEAFLASLKAAVREVQEANQQLNTELKEVVRKSEGRKKEFSQALKQEKQLLDDSISDHSPSKQKRKRKSNE